MTPTDAELDELETFINAYVEANDDIHPELASRSLAAIRALRAELDACNPARYRDRKRREADA
jgi:hypothetical protein